jgi:hypothetical protein
MKILKKKKKKKNVMGKKIFSKLLNIPIQGGGNNFHLTLQDAHTPLKKINL